MGHVVEIRGKTYPIRAELKALGAYWRAGTANSGVPGYWDLPSSRLAEAKVIAHEYGVTLDIVHRYAPHQKAESAEVRAGHPLQVLAQQEKQKHDRDIVNRPYAKEHGGRGIQHLDFRKPVQPEITHTWDAWTIP